MLLINAWQGFWIAYFGIPAFIVGADASSPWSWRRSRSIASRMEDRTRERRLPGYAFIAWNGRFTSPAQLGPLLIVIVVSLVWAVTRASPASTPASSRRR
ncbi:hypothetical protein DLE60_09155 [Micromonospora globispora]|uniref:Uncharacterized protein n=1 Tax=Micromonospora globispora TaxID=1450148 RepID=A0A317K3A2_9ACTN|nr:hypothetical protein [Micromonospora globispora]PWU47341.1 hypothetical protein DLJ46_14940 [Micromonospora globispora]PWU60798.1 hypothetical protein DLE60_09155 [Micromonospora globispora]RQW98169.1 hypothetical protein DKL51_10930 [Micromonospora globispora]